MFFFTSPSLESNQLFSAHQRITPTRSTSTNTGFIFTEVRVSECYCLHGIWGHFVGRLSTVLTQTPACISFGLRLCHADITHVAPLPRIHSIVLRLHAGAICGDCVRIAATTNQPQKLSDEKNKRRKNKIEPIVVFHCMCVFALATLYPTHTNSEPSFSSSQH